MSDMRAVFPIDRDALQDAVFGYLAEMGVDEWDLVQPIRRMIQDAPTLDYAPVDRGRWGIPEIIGYNGLHAVYGAECSECGAYSKEYHRLFCSNCGARMDGKEGGDDD